MAGTLDSNVKPGATPDPSLGADALITFSLDCGEWSRREDGESCYRSSENQPQTTKWKSTSFNWWTALAINSPLNSFYVGVSAADERVDRLGGPFKLQATAVIACKR